MVVMIAMLAFGFGYLHGITDQHKRNKESSYEK